MTALTVADIVRRERERGQPLCAQSVTTAIQRGHMTGWRATRNEWRVDEASYLIWSAGRRPRGRRRQRGEAQP